MLTSADECVDVFDFSDGGMVAVCHEGLDGVQETVHVDDGPRVPDPVLEFPEPVQPVLVRLAFRGLLHVVRHPGSNSRETLHFVQLR